MSSRLYSSKRSGLESKEDVRKYNLISHGKLSSHYLIGPLVIPSLRQTQAQPREPTLVHLLGYKFTGKFNGVQQSAE